MDIEKLIVSLRSPSWQDLEDPDAPLLEDAAHALSTLQIENQALRNAASGFKAENEKLREMYQKEKAVCHATQAKLDQMKRENETLKHALQNWHEED